MVKAIRGCEKDVPSRSIQGYEITRCPLTFCGLAETQRIQAFKEYSRGFLPNRGTWLDQPMKFTQVMNLIEKELRQSEDDEVNRG